MHLIDELTWDLKFRQPVDHLLQVRTILFGQTIQSLGEQVPMPIDKSGSLPECLPPLIVDHSVFAGSAAFGPTARPPVQLSAEPAYGVVDALVEFFQDVENAQLMLG